MRVEPVPNSESASISELRLITRATAPYLDACSIIGVEEEEEVEVGHERKEGGALLVANVSCQGIKILREGECVRGRLFNIRCLIVEFRKMPT